MLLVMDVETKAAFADMHDRFATLTEVFMQRFDILDADMKDVKSEIKRLDASVEAIPDKIDGIYGNTVNDVLDRLTVLEEKAGISNRS